MTTYNTGNPLGSAAAKDLFDNAQSLDFAVNDITKLIWKDRFGKSRKTLWGIEQVFSAQLASQYERFNAFIASAGYKVLGDYIDGPYTVSDYNQLIRYQDEFYKLTADTDIPFTTTGNNDDSWEIDSVHFVSAGDGVIRQDLRSSDINLGDALITVKSPLGGSVARAMHDVNADSISVMDFGAIADGTYHPLSERFTSLSLAQAQYQGVQITSLDQSIDWAATQAALNGAKSKGRQIRAPAGAYVINDTIHHPAGVRVFGDGPMENPSNSPDTGRTFKLIGTVFLAFGDAPKTHVANLAATDGTTTGDTHSNLSSVESGYDSTYKMTSFWNNDADITTGAAATQKKFSCAWKMESGGFSQLRDISLLPYFGDGGVEGYNSATLTLADDWDIGIWLDNHHDAFVSNVTVVGYWRMAALFGRTCISINETIIPDFERNRFSHCVFQGWSSLTIRGADLYDIKAVGSDYIDIDWFDSHPFDPAFDNAIRTQEYGGGFYSYTGTQKVGDFLRLTGVTPTPSGIDPSNASNVVILGRQTNGVADTLFDNCYFFALNHQAKVRATSASLGAYRFANPSRGIEISGASVRGLKFNRSCKIITGDDIAIYQGNSLGLQWYGDMESKNFESRGSGIRMVAGPRTYQTRIGQSIRGSSGVDCRPAYPTTDSRFTNVSDTGMFSPNQSLWDGWNIGMTGHLDLRPGAGQRVSFMDADGNPRLVRGADGEFNLFSQAGVRLQRYLPSTDTMSMRANVLNLANSAGQNRVITSTTDAGLSGQVVRLWSQDASTVMGRFDSSTGLIDFGGSVRPGTDATLSLGTSARRWTTVYATNTTISSSDARLKTAVRKLDNNEVSAGLALAEELGIWQWLDRVESEGDSARLHAGMTVQKAIDIMNSFGLDAMAYAFICYDEWEDEYEDRPAITSEDDEGNAFEVIPAETVKVTEKGDIYSFRMNELQAFIMAASVQQQKQLSEKLEDLISKVEQLSSK